MERSKYLLITLLLTINAFSLFSQFQVDSMFQAYLKGNMNYWQQQVDLFSQRKDLSYIQQMNILSYQYGLIGFYLGEKNKKMASPVFHNASKRLEILREEQDCSQLLAYASAFIGYQIAFTPIKAPFIGPKSITLAEEAIKMNPNQPWGYIQLGNVKNYAPAMFGGSRGEAIKYYKIAKEKFQQVPNYQTNWQYLSLLTTIAQTHAMLGNLDQAVTLFQDILQQYPNYKWVKEKLLPQAKSRLNAN